MASKLSKIHDMVQRSGSVISLSSPSSNRRSSNADSSSSLSPSSHSSSSTDQYEYPRGYFEALINNAKVRYDEASKFYYIKRTYSAKFGFYITLLQDLFIELASPPPTLPPDTYDKLAKLRQDIRRLQLNLESRRDLLNTSTVDLSKSKTDDKSGIQDSIYEQEAARAKLARLRQMEMAQLLQTITDLSLQELQIRQRRLEAEAEYRRQFNENPPTPPAALALTLPSNPVPPSVSSTIQSPDFESDADEFENLHPSIYKINYRPPNGCVFCFRYHWSHLCLEIPTLEGRQQFYRKFKICFLCGKSHGGLCHPFDRYCKWPQCAAKNDHHSAVCPNVTYPITDEITSTYIGQLKELKKRHGVVEYYKPSVKSSRASCAWDDYSYSSSRKAAKRSNRRRRYR